MKNGKIEGSLERIFSGFQTISQTDKTAYLEHLERVIENEKILSEKNRLKRFKRKLQNEIRLSKTNVVSAAILQREVSSEEI